MFPKSNVKLEECRTIDHLFTTFTFNFVSNASNGRLSKQQENAL